MTQTASLHERLGGDDGLTAAVGLFYDRVVADPILSPFFTSLNMKAQVQKMVSFMAFAFGSRGVDAVRDLTEAHAHLVRNANLGDVHFDAVLEHLDRALVSLSVDAALRAEVAAVVETTRNAVLGRGAST